jgi:hypothetical protein
MSDGSAVVGSRPGVPPQFRQPPLEVPRASVQSAMGCRRPLAHRPSAARRIRRGAATLIQLSAMVYASYPRLLLIEASDVLILGSSFPCKMLVFSSGAEGNRTPDLRRAKALRAFRVRPGVSTCVA